jgi:hypothetical protein
MQVLYELLLNVVYSVMYVVQYINILKRKVNSIIDMTSENFTSCLCQIFSFCLISFDG